MPLDDCGEPDPFGDDETEDPLDLNSSYPEDDETDATGLQTPPSPGGMESEDDVSLPAITGDDGGIKHEAKDQQRKINSATEAPSGGDVRHRGLIESKMVVGIVPPGKRGMSRKYINNLLQKKDSESGILLPLVSSRSDKVSSVTAALGSVAAPSSLADKMLALNRQLVGDDKSAFRRRYRTNKKKLSSSAPTWGTPKSSPGSAGALSSVSHKKYYPKKPVFSSTSKLTSKTSQHTLSFNFLDNNTLLPIAGSLNTYDSPVPKVIPKKCAETKPTVSTIVMSNNLSPVVNSIISTTAPAATTVTTTTSLMSSSSNVGVVENTSPSKQEITAARISAIVEKWKPVDAAATVVIEGTAASATVIASTTTTTTTTTSASLSEQHQTQDEAFDGVVLSGDEPPTLNLDSISVEPLPPHDGDAGGVGLMPGDIDYHPEDYELPEDFNPFDLEFTALETTPSSSLKQKSGEEVDEEGDPEELNIPRLALKTSSGFAAHQKAKDSLGYVIREDEGRDQGTPEHNDSGADSDAIDDPTYDSTNRLCCPKCKFKTKNLQIYQSHALYHTKGSKRKRKPPEHYVASFSPDNSGLTKRHGRPKFSSPGGRGGRSPVKSPIKAGVSSQNKGPWFKGADLDGGEKEPQHSHGALSCGKCPYTTNSFVRLRSHMFKHGKNFSCPYCSFRTNNEATMTRHRDTHSDQRKFNCPYCIFTTLNQRYFMVHKAAHKMHRKGGNDKKKNALLRPNISKTRPLMFKFKCPKCNYITLSTHSYKAHMKTHGDVGLYECVCCTFTTADEVEYKEHLLNHDCEPSVG